MKTLLICPANRNEVAQLARSVPLALLPIFGQSLLAHWLEYLAGLGATHVYILAADRPEQIRSEAGNGERWGLTIEVLEQIRELGVEEATRRFQAPGVADWLESPWDVVLLDHLPESPQMPLFNSYASWYAAVHASLLRLSDCCRVGVREVRPGVWIGRHTVVAPDAEVRPPCWLGENVCVSAGAIVGPDAIIEDRAYIERAADISKSMIGPDTFVGSLTEVRESLALESLLINWRMNSAVIVPDQFLLCGHHSWNSHGYVRPAWGTRFAAVIALLLKLPWTASAALRVTLASFRRNVLQDRSPNQSLKRTLVSQREIVQTSETL